MRDLFRFLFRQRNNLLFFALLAIGISMTINGNMHQRAQAITSSNAVVGRLYDWRSGITEFASLREVNHALAEELGRERERNRSVIMERDSGTVVRDTVRHMRYRFITAQVINSTTHKQKNYLTLDKGTQDGIAAGMGVIGASGIVGVVREASAHFATVISVLNDDHVASAQLKHTGHFGLLRWNTGDPRTVSLADIDKHVPVTKGDTVVTRGSENVYPPGILIGTVDTVAKDASIPFHVITVKLAEDLTRTGYVHVIVDLMREEQQALEAQAPQP